MTDKERDIALKATLKVLEGKKITEKEAQLMKLYKKLYV